MWETVAEFEARFDARRRYLHMNRVDAEENAKANGDYSQVVSIARAENELDRQHINLLLAVGVLQIMRAKVLDEGALKRARAMTEEQLLKEYAARTRMLAQMTGGSVIIDVGKEKKWEKVQKK